MSQTKVVFLLVLVVTPIVAIGINISPPYRIDRLPVETMIVVGIILALPMLIIYCNAKRIYRCPSCRANFSMRRVKRIGHLHQCNNCGERKYIKRQGKGGPM